MLPELYTPVIGEGQSVYAEEIGHNAASTLEALLERLFNGEKLISDNQLLRATARDYTEALQRGYGGKVTDIDWKTPDFDTLEKLTQNVYQFAAAKNYHELRDLTDAIRDGDKIRSFNEFQEAAKPIIGKYNQKWLRTEYNQAIAAAQSGARWNDFQRGKKEMPYLQYQCVMDGNTRQEHAMLHGVIKRIDDDFWDKYMPPNGWGCRCEAIQLPGSSYDETPNTEISIPIVPEMFKVNFGKQGMVFPPTHAYFKEIPKKVWLELEPKIRQNTLRYFHGLAKSKMPSTGNDLVEFSNLQTGKLKRSSTIRDRLVNPKHVRTIEEAKAVQYAWTHPDKLQFERISELGEGKDTSTTKDALNLEGKSKRGVLGYIQYSFQYDGKEYHIKTERMDDGFEQLYSLTIPK